MTRQRRKCVQISDSDNENKQSSAQDDNRDVIEIAHRIVRDTKNIRNKKRKGIEDDFNKQESELNVKIEKLFELRQAAVAKLQNDAWEKLEALNEKLQFIEGSILTSMTNLEFATLNMTKQMILVLRKSIHNHQEINFGTVDN
ncbi:hypothetical protein EV44_g5289 [Erysiphe necator]|uniref:Uncharacterized protein n=1 Tax=Uncinula necator TaxID=52586 RepID=A0A0B1P3F0_UNCNE|nr:hypothetical protein EV44_g5289 [Erysiphe necator]